MREIQKWKKNKKCEEKKGEPTREYARESSTDVREWYYVTWIFLYSEFGKVASTLLPASMIIISHTFLYTSKTSHHKACKYIQLIYLLRKKIQERAKEGKKLPDITVF